MTTSVIDTPDWQDIFERITSELPLELKEILDELLQPPDGDNRSRLFRLKEYPPHASAPAIIKYIERYRLVEEIVANRITLGGIDPRMVDYLAQAMNAGAVERRLSDQKRIAAS